MTPRAWGKGAAASLGAVRAVPDPSGAAGGLRQLLLRSSYSSGRDDLLADFYVPALSRANRYDRIAGYFASSAFVSAAAGLARFVNGGGTIRLIVGVQLSDADCAALRGCATFDEVLTNRLSTGALRADDVSRRRLEVIAWLVLQGRLEMRVGVPCAAGGEPLPADHLHNDGRYFHIKSGILHDGAGDSVVFCGSINESSQGWQRNYEQFSVYRSWRPEAWADHGRPEVQRFETLWSGDSEPGWRTVALPAAFEHQLLQLVPDDCEPPGRDPAETPGPDPPDEDGPKAPSAPDTAHTARLNEAERAAIAEIRQAPLSATGVGLVSAAVEPWPHQINIARRILDTWPRSYLLADQVGLGKTIEIGLVLRELLLSRRAATALILVPASVLIQWQQELFEKFCLDVARLDGGDLVFSDPARRRPLRAGAGPWTAEPVLLASSQLARRRAQRRILLETPGWDLVVLDEAHHARRSSSKPNASPNQMLALLRDLKRHGKFKALLLASATPMQMHPHELWDLLWLLGLPERWDRSAEAMQSYYEQFAEGFENRDWDFIRCMVQAHLATAEAPSDKRTAAALQSVGPVAQHRIRGFAEGGLHRPRAVPSDERRAWDEWLRACTPVRDRVFRTTRATLRSYEEDGLLPAGTVIPERSITDSFDDLGEAQEMYQRIDRYIRARYRASSKSKDPRARALGFIMTVYRRRLTSSLHAIRCSLQRRRDVLEQRAAVWKLLDDDDRHAAEGTLQFDEFDESAFGTASGDMEGSALTGGIDDYSALSGGGSEPGRGSAPSRELDEIDRFIADLVALPPDEPKMLRLARILADGFTSGHRNAVVFTQYADTLRYIRERLLGTYRNGLACYYGGTGEVWDNDAERWVDVGKEQIKSRFRSGALQILIGTDSMSEGLNLQTCALMVNFDLPWNFIRVEQRIGRLDRIGGRPRIEVHNLYYRDTVEVDIYTKLRDRFGSFEAVLGRSAPVLSAVEGAFQDAAMGVISPERASQEIETSLKRADSAAVKPDDLDAVPEPAGELAPAMTLDGLRDRLLSLPPAAARLAPDPERGGVWLLMHDTDAAGTPHREPGAGVAVTLDRETCAIHDDVTLLTWGSPLLEGLLDEIAPARRPGVGRG